MHELTTGIMLSSGTTINIPIFPYNREREIITQMGIAKVRHYNRGATSPAWESLAGLSDTDLFELAQLLNTTVITIYANDDHVNPPNVPTGVVDIYHGYFLCWIENADGTYSFLTNITGTASGGGGPYLNEGYICYHGPVEHPDYYPNIFYDGENLTATNFTTYCNNIEGSISTNDLALNMTSNSFEVDYIGLFPYGVISGNKKVDHEDYIQTCIANYVAIDPNANIQAIVTDIDDPYSYEASTVGGGDGRYGSFDPNSIDPALIPSLPTISVANAGFISVYNPTVNQLKSLSQFLWSSAFDIDSFKKLFADPMQCIIGLSVVPVRPTLGSAKHVMFGDVDTEVSMTAIASEYVEKDMGSVTIDLLYGSFMDYQDKIMIYLPYIGFRELDPIDIVGHSIHVVYHINVLDGGTTAYISVSDKGVMYQFSGSCIANIPLSSINYSGALQNAISAVAGISLGNGAMTLKNVAGVATHMKGQIDRSGNVSGSSGLMGVQRPYVIIERANISVPALANNFRGNTSNITMTLGSCNGFTKVDKIHLDNVICTENERDELLELLQEGVMIYEPEPIPE